MKMFKLLAATVVAGLFATTSQAGIVGSKHDFSSNAFQGKVQICVPCHAPHGANNAAKGNNGSGPLWNHAVGDTSRTYVFTAYDSAGVGTVETGIKLDPNTMLCMSCHDGTIALDSFGGVTGSSFIGTGGRVTLPGAGNDLTGTHPLGSNAAYPTTDGITASAPYMVAPYLLKGQKLDTVVGSPTFNTYISDSTKTSNIGALKVLDGKWVVGCTTCHEPHNRKGTSPGVTNMLWIANNGSLVTNGNGTVPGSGLCLSCHKK